MIDCKVMFSAMRGIQAFRFLYVLALYIPSVCLGQDQADQNWYFGNTANGIQFTRPGDTARLVTRPVAGIAAYGNGGGAVATDPTTGGLLFYTDGTAVYDATHRQMPNGAGLGGNNSGNQPAVVARVPGQTNRYFIFTNDATTAGGGTIRVSEVDMTLQGTNSSNPNFPAPPLGDVGAIKASAIPGLTGQSEAMVLIAHDNGTDYWLITHTAGTDNYNVTPVLATGVGATVAATPGTGMLYNASHFAYHTPTGQLAVAPSDLSRNVMILNFDDATGALTFNAANGFVFNSAAPTTGAVPGIYDVEWSNSGNYLYVSRQNDLIQFDRVNTSVTPASVLPQTIAASYGVQTGPDSSVYHIYQATAGGPFLVGRMTDPDTTVVNYEPLPFGSVNFNARQFPSFMPRTRIVHTLDFSVSGTCANAPSVFFPEVDPGADSLVWDFGDATGFSSEWSPTYTYSQGGTYNVTMIAYSGTDSTVYTEAVTITQFDLQIQLVQDTTACSCELRFPKADPPPPPCTPFTLTATATGQTGAIQWFGPSGALAGQNSLTLTSVDSAGYYYVIVQDPAGSGCAAYAGVNIREYGFDDPRSNIWYFGNNGGINFNADFRPSTGADAIVGDLISAEGTAVICDRNGQVIFSTNGEQVFDRDGNPLALGLGGSQNSTQSALIIPNPTDPTLYYIFVTQEVYPASAPGYELRYAVFDLKQLPNGNLIDPDNDPTNGASTGLFTKSTERITGNQNWLIAHEYGNNNFRAYRITGQGISAPVISSIGSDHSLAVAENAQGYMKLSPNYILAVALSNPGTSNVVEIFDFADSTGAVTNFRTVDLQQPAGQVYGIEFSPGGTKLFASTIGAGSSLHEFAYDSATGTYIRKPAIPVVAAQGEIGALQRGPDGTIYVATNGSTSLGTINANENRDLPSNFTDDGFALVSGTSSTLGLPNFIQNITDPTQTPSIMADGFCLGSPTLFQGSGTDPIDTLTWFFGDGSSQRGVNLTEVEHTYSQPGTYIVTLRLSNRCVGVISPSLVDTVTISPIPNALSGVVSLCTGTERMEAVAPADATPDLVYAWSHGDTTRDPIPPAQGDYTVTVTNAAGCAAQGDWEVFDNRPQVELGPDRTICENTPTITLDAGNPGSTYQWTRNGTAIGGPTTQTVSVPTTPPTTGVKYRVVVSNPFNGCVIRDSVVFTINPQVNFTLAGNPPSNCGMTDGSIDLDIQSTGTFSYIVSGPVSSAVADQTGPTAPPINVPGLSAGTYTVQVLNQVTGCFDQQTLGLSDASFTVVIARAAQCNDANDEMRISIDTNPDQTAFNYRIFENGNATPVTSANNVSEPATTIPLPNGSYSAEVTKAGCIAVSPVTLIEGDPQEPITGFTIDNCAPSITVQTAGQPSWTAGAGINPPVNSNTVAPTLTASGSYTYVLNIGPLAGNCPNDTTFVLDYILEPPASITQSNQCDDFVTLAAAPTGTYVYSWERNGASIPGGQQIQITTTDNNVPYQVTVQNTTTGCTFSASYTPAVLGELTVDIVNDQPCEGTDYVLTAQTNQTPDSYNWTLDDQPVTGGNAATLTVTDDSEGLFKVLVRRAAAGLECTAEDSVQITVAPVTAGLLTDTGIICPDPANTDPTTREVELDPGPDFISYNWFQDGAALNVTTRTYTATETGTYSVDLINSFGCPSSDQITLIEECDPRITGPNAFRPGGLNKEFFLLTFFIADTPFEIFIFNRWGEMVFHSDDRNFRWNGGYNNQAGQSLPPGTYSYLVKFKSSYRPQDGVQEYRGGVVLLR